MKLNNHSKIMIVGTSGSGKSTLAGKLSQKLGVADIELDALFWKKNWTQAEPEEFRQKILASISNKNGFIIHGNYSKTQDITLGNCDTLIWLDYSRLIVMWRVFTRSLLRIITSKTLWAGNKEGFKKTFFSKESIILWSWNTYSLRKQQYQKLINNSEYSNLQIIRFTNPVQTKKFMASFNIEFKKNH